MSDLNPTPALAERRPRLQDVAAAAGVSIVTVSRAMNAPGTVSDATRRRIADAMEAVGYVPDLVARSMAKRRTGIVAAFVPTLTDPNFAHTVQGLSEALATEGLHLLLGHTGYSLDAEEALVAATLGRRPDGLVLTGTMHRGDLDRRLARADVPVVEMWNVTRDAQRWQVGFSNSDAVRATTAHLLARGRRRIGYVGRPVADNDRATARRAGFLAAMRAAGLEPAPEHLMEVETTMGAGELAVERLVRRIGLEALVFSGDSAAAGAVLACLARGMRVPDDVAVTGVGDQEIARMIPGGLTTVRIDSRRIGFEAGQLLLTAMAGRGDKPRSVDIGFELVVRGST